MSRAVSLEVYGRQTNKQTSTEYVHGPPFVIIWTGYKLVFTEAHPGHIRKVWGQSFYTSWHVNHHHVWVPFPAADDSPNNKRLSVTATPFSSGVTGKAKTSSRKSSPLFPHTSHQGVFSPQVGLCLPQSNGTVKEIFSQEMESPVRPLPSHQEGYQQNRGGIGEGGETIIKSVKLLLFEPVSSEIKLRLLFILTFFFFKLLWFAQGKKSTTPCSRPPTPLRTPLFFNTSSSLPFLSCL